MVTEIKSWNQAKRYTSNKSYGKYNDRLLEPRFKCLRIDNQATTRKKNGYPKQEKYSIITRKNGTMYYEQYLLNYCKTTIA